MTEFMIEARTMITATADMQEFIYKTDRGYIFERLENGKLAG